MSNQAIAKPKFNIFNLEADLISSLVQDKQLCATFMEEIEPEFFESADCKNLFRVVKTYHSSRHAIPTKDQTLSLVKKMELKSGVSSITMAETISKVYDRGEMLQHEIDHIKEELTRFIKMYKVRKAMAESISLIDDDNKFPEIEEKIRTAVLWTVDDRLGTDIRDVEKRYLKIEELNESFVLTPFPHLNQTIGGGMFRKTLTIVAASSSIGKSIILDNCAIDAWRVQGLDVVLITLELSEEIKGMRIDTALTGITMNELEKNKKEVFGYYERMGEKDNYLIIKEFAAKSISSRHISSFVRKVALHKGRAPAVIIIDYMDLLLPNSMKRASLYEDGGDVSEQIRGLGYEFNCPVLSASQLSRQATNLDIDKISEVYMSESHKKMNTADNLFVLGGTLQQRQNGQLYLKTLKARMGRKDQIIPMTVDYPMLRISEDYC